MTYQINKAQFESVTSLSADKRYGHFITKITDFEEVWTLKSSDGFVLYGDENGNEVAPFWPHPDYAEKCKGDQWSDCDPFKIDLKVFIERLLPGMSNDEKLVGVFPTEKNKGVVVTPEKLENDLLEELKQYE